MSNNHQYRGSPSRGRRNDRGRGRGEGDSIYESPRSPSAFANDRGNTSSPSTQKGNRPPGSIKPFTGDAAIDNWARFAADPSAYSAQKGAQQEPTIPSHEAQIIKDNGGSTFTGERLSSSAFSSQPSVTKKLPQETENTEQTNGAAQLAQYPESVPVILSKDEISAEQRQELQKPMQTLPEEDLSKSYHGSTEEGQELLGSKEPNDQIGSLAQQGTPHRAQHNEDNFSDPVVEAVKTYTEPALEYLLPHRYGENSVPEGSRSRSNTTDDPSSIKDESGSSVSENSPDFDEDLVSTASQRNENDTKMQSGINRQDAKRTASVPSESAPPSHGTSDPSGGRSVTEMVMGFMNKALRGPPARPSSFEQASIEQLTSQTANDRPEIRQSSVESHILATKKFLEERTGALSSEKGATMEYINSLSEGEITPKPGNTTSLAASSKAQQPLQNSGRGKEAKNSLDRETPLQKAENTDLSSKSSSERWRLLRPNFRREEVQDPIFNSRFRLQQQQQEHASKSHSDHKSSRKDKQRSALRNMVENLTYWVFKYPLLILICLIGASMLLNRLLQDSYKPLPGQSIYPTQDLINLSKTSLLRASEAEWALQSTVTDTIHIAQANDGKHRPCTAFLLDQIIDMKPLRQAEQVALTFIYRSMLPRLQTIIFLPEMSVHNLSSIYNDINQASQHLSNLDRRIMQHIHAQRVNSTKCANTIPGLSVKVPPPPIRIAVQPQMLKMKLARAIQPLLLYLTIQFPTLARFLPANPTANGDGDANNNTASLVGQDGELTTALHATPFDNHFRLIERSLQRSRHGHKGLRDELRRLENDVNTVAKAWFTEEQLLLINLSRSWMRQLVQVGSKL